MLETTVTLVAGTPLNCTLAPIKLLPVIVTCVPIQPLVGLKKVMLGGGGVTLNELVLTTVPQGVMTLMGPSVAPVGTVVLIWLLESTMNAAEVPLN